MEAMILLLILSFAGCLFSLMLTPLVRDVSLGLGLVDRPGDRRKIHALATPRTGGVAIICAYAGAYGLLMLLPVHGGGLVRENLIWAWRLMPPVALVFGTGLLDDWIGLQPWQKLAGQFAGAVGAYIAGVRIPAAGAETASNWWSLLLTVGWLILCSNAFNLIDGIDGLAAGAAVTATATTLIAGVLQGNMTLGLATAPLAGCLLGFLRYNFSPASIFLGDSGSLPIGFLLGCYGAVWSQKSATMMGLAAPAMAMGLPLVEVAVSVVRRFLRGEPIFTGDRGHIHHLLLDRGFTPRRAALALYGVCGIAAAFSLLESVLRGRFSGFVVLLFGVCVWLGVRYLGYSEFDAVRRLLWGGFRPLLKAHVQIALLERSLASAQSVEECWGALDRAARALGYSHVTARIGGTRFGAPSPRVKDDAFWQMRLNLPGGCYVNITQSHGKEQPILVIPFAEAVRRVLPAKLVALAIDGAPESDVALERLEEAIECSSSLQAAVPWNSSTSSVTSSACAAP